MTPVLARNPTPAAIRATLVRLNLSQTRAARLLGVDARTVRRWIAGDIPVPVPVCRLLGAAEAVPGVLGYLIARVPTGPPTPQP